MVTRLNVDESLRLMVIKLFKENKTIRAISDKVNRAKSVVGRIVKDYKKTGRVCSPNKKGRPRITSKREDRIIQRSGLKHRFASAASISRQIENTKNLKISRFTISRRLNEIGLYARRPQKKPLISRRNKTKRLKFANKYVNKPMEWWHKVFFSDESKFNLFGNDGINYVRRFEGEKYSTKCTKNTVKFGGGSVMVFGMFSAQGTNPLVRLNIRVNAANYKHLLDDHVVPILNKSDVTEPIFMQDNAPCHKAKSVLNYLEQQKVEVLDWPAQSPDLNPIENLWKVLGERVMSKNPTNTEKLWELLQCEWNKIDVDFCKKLIDSCHRRCSEVIKNKGSFTKY